MILNHAICLGVPPIHKGKVKSGTTVRAYVINLARSRDRRAHITAELRKTNMGYEIITDVNWRDLDLSDTRQYHRRSFLSALTQFLPGTAEAALSHLSVHRKMIEDGLDKALVLEDEVMLPDDLGAWPLL
jgi:glycosyl transferase, family 25